jgi:hypothetical protein
MTKMKLILSTNSSVAVRVPSEDVVPDKGLIEQDLINFVMRLYRFPAPPQILPTPNGNHLLFQGGKAVIGTDTYPVMQLAVIPNGDIITSTTTDIGAMIIRDFIQNLDEGLGYRFSKAPYHFNYISNLITEFDKPLEQLNNTFSVIERLLGDAIDRPSGPFKLKRLAFGFGNPRPPSIINLEAFDNADFIIERRADVPYSQNRYFCSAPLQTGDHIRVLEQIESTILRGSANS